jgi:serine/threonine protein kinase
LVYRAANGRPKPAPGQAMDEEAIFSMALEMEAANQRAAYLDRACAGNAGLRRKVEELLGAHGRAGQFLDHAAAAWNAHLPTSDEPSRTEGPGTVIGPYRLLEQIGEGGMGLVFMADQAQPVKRRVALKVLKPGMDTRQVVARFEAERQALALMDHPNIAKIHDGGTTESGRPYFVMELVRGVPITEFCDQHRLTTRQRLELFVTVCQAVQHAHQKGIIHRDLKPSNVLVTLHDTLAVPKVIDFGIAKATTGPLTERTLFTHFAQMIGTPLYMSPEQAEMNGLDVDTRSDVYALGVLLYELLTGTTPFTTEALRRAGLDEMRRMIREEEPPTPSQRLNTLDAQASTTVAERRGVDGRRLGQMLRGELDWIVMRALEKDRVRRYESASAFAADVQRYLSDEAVSACPPSAGYRLRKYVRRNRRALVTAGVIVAALVIATVVSIWQAARATEAQHQAEADRKQAEVDRDRAKSAEKQAEADRKQAETDRDRAKTAEGEAKTNLERAKEEKKRADTEAAIAKAVNDFLQGDLIGQVMGVPEFSEASAGNPQLTVKEALDRAAAKIGDRFRDQPLVEAAIQMTIGGAYNRLYQNGNGLAVPHLERALKLRQDHLGPDHPDTLATMNILANAYQCLDRHGEAIALMERRLEIGKATLGPDHPETLSFMAQLAWYYQWAGQWDLSVRLCEQWLDKRRTIHGPTHLATLSAMHRLAMCYMDMGRLEDSMALHAKVQDGLNATNRPRQDYPALFRESFALTCQRVGELDRADQLLRDELELIMKREDSLMRRNSRANILGWLALNLLLQERHGDAERTAREAIAIDQIEKFRRFYWMSVLGAALLGQKKYADAEPFLLQGYGGMKQWETGRRAADRRQLLRDAVERLVRFYEATEQPEKAREWREKIKRDRLDLIPDSPK